MAHGHVTGSRFSARPDRCLIVQLCTELYFERHIYLAQLPIVWLVMQKALLGMDAHIFLLRDPLSTLLVTEDNRCAFKLRLKELPCYCHYQGC